MRKVALSGILVFVILCFTNASAQITVADSLRRLAMANAVQTYQDYITFAAPLYSGPQYVEYFRQVQRGQPFFINTDFHTGSILYDGILYNDVPLKYDELEDKLVLSDPSGTFRLCPDIDKVPYFTIGTHQFVKLIREAEGPSAPHTGFYEVLYNGSKALLFKKESKKIVQDVTGQSKLQRFILQDIEYFIKKGNRYYSVSKQRQVLNVFKDRRPDLRQWIAKNGADFENNKENALLDLVSYYDNLK